MSRPRANPPAVETYVCLKCGATVAPPDAGSRERNHCPECLWSVHVDLRPGDRLCGCRGLMAPIGVWTKENGEWALIHRCNSCGFLRANRIAADDDELRLFTLAARPLTRLPFPYRMIETIKDR